MKNHFKSLIAALFPQRCAYCLKAIPSNALMCSECEKDLPRIIGTVCPKCGREKEACTCKGAEMYYSAIAAPFYYRGKVRRGIHAFKFRKYSQNADAYAVEMAETVKDRFGSIKFDFITEVPMTKRSLKKRGYDQGALLAEKVSRILSIEHKNNVLTKLYETDKQHNLSFYLRRGNLTGVFDVIDPSAVDGKTILIADDISTSGETLNECAKMLWLYGAKDIYCITVALTVYEKKKNS